LWIVQKIFDAWRNRNVLTLITFDVKGTVMARNLPFAKVATSVLNAKSQGSVLRTIGYTEGLVGLDDPAN
jgi:hypothetical protein